MSFLLFALAAAAAQPPAVPAAVQTIKEGDTFVMRTLDGARPIYTFDKDEPGKSNCVDRCLAAWPAVVAPAGAKPIGKWTSITRADGTAQWAYEGKPVYTFVRDTEGTATGDGMGGSWHLLPTVSAK
jgi:predicted lipoprotein with Yx(FWY)xxD motif